jgi:tetratricopeptide (TPR) repeat protein
MERRQTTFALILAAAFVAYLPALRGGLLWDDTSHVTRPDLQSLHGLWRIWFHLGATQQYYPLLHSAFWVEHRIWGDAVLGYHLTNVLLHAASACLVVLIVRRLGLPGAWLAGLLFALHPVCVESVAWISEQKSTLSGFFYLASALAYLRFDWSRRVWRYVLALGLFVLALLTKTVTATLPAALLVVFWWQRGRVDWKRDVLPLAPWLALGASAGLFTAWVERTYIGAHGADFGLTLLQRVLVAGRAIWFYAGKLVWPANLTFFYPRWKVDPSQWWQYLFPAGVLAVASGLAWLAHRHRGPLAGFLIFAGTLFPVLGFFDIYPFRYAYVADHFEYLASLGILVPAAVLLVRWRVAIPAALLAVLGVLTWGQSTIYRDSDTLYRETLERNPDSWLAHNNLGNSLLERGRRDEAMAHFQAALRVKPDYWEAHLSLGNALAEIPGRLPDAITEYQAAIRNEPNSERAHNNLGNALTRAGRLREAVAELQIVLRLEPNYAEAHNNLGNVFSLMPGRLPDAITEYQAAIRNQPNLPEAHNNLGRCLAQVPGRLPEALGEFEAAIRLRPDYWSAHNNMGNALSEIPGRLADAIAEYRTAVRIEPNSPNAHYNLGNALSRIPGRLSEAVAEYETALRIQPDNADAHFRLAGALAQLRAGRK